MWASLMHVICVAALGMRGHNFFKLPVVVYPIALWYLEFGKVY